MCAEDTYSLINIFKFLHIHAQININRIHTYTRAHTHDTEINGYDKQKITDKLNFM